MGFAKESGYTPSDFVTVMTAIMNGVNEQFGTEYTYETFVGTGFYKYAYGQVQRIIEHEVKMSEIFLYLQQYFTVTNELISRPRVTAPGILEALDEADYIASVKPPLDADAGKIYVCVDVDDAADEYATQKLEICTIIKDSTVGGVVSQGTEVETIVLSNSQSFDFKFNLPNRIPVILRLTTVLSENNQVVIPSPDDQKALLLANMRAKYRLGKNFEPQRYFTIEDGPWCASVLLEWSDDDGSNWYSTVYDAAYDDLFDFGLADITLVET